MTWALFLDLLGAWFGLASAGLFSLGVLQLSDRALQIISSSFWSSGEEMAVELAQQKADFRYGAFFLLLSFVVQLVSKIFRPLQNISVFEYFWNGVAASFGITAVLFFITAALLIKRRKIVTAKTRAYNAG